MHIINPTRDFDFSNVSVADQPLLVNDNVFVPLTYNGNPMYVQTPVGTTKSGIVCRTHSKHVDLLFDTASDATAEFNAWIKMLEQKCRDLVVEKSDLWFQNSLDTSDVDDSMMSIAKSFESGRYYSLRSQIKSSHPNRDELIVYTEDKHLVSMADITAESRIISILEIRGLHFSDKLVRFEIDVKQMMTLTPEPEPEPMELEPINLFSACQIETELDTETLHVGGAGADVKVDPRATNLGLGSPETIYSANAPPFEGNEDSTTNIVTDEFLEEDYDSPPMSLALATVPSITIEIDAAKEEVIELGEMPAVKSDSAPSPAPPPIIKDRVDDDDMVEITATDMLGDLSQPSLSLKPKREIYYAMYRTAKKRSDVFKQEYQRALAESVEIMRKYGLNVDDEDGADEHEHEHENDAGDS